MQIKKRLIPLILLIFFFIPAFSAIAAEIQQITFVVGQSNYLVNGQVRQMDAATFIESSRTFVPARYLGDALDATTRWNRETKTVTLLLNNTKVDLIIGSKIITINGEANQLDVAPVIKNSRTYLPARHVAEAFDYKAKWERESKAAIIYPPKKLAKTIVLDQTSIDNNNNNNRENEETTLELEISKENAVTKATITAFQEIDYKVFKLTDPGRLVIDIYGVSPGNLPRTVIVNSEAISQVRVGWFSSNPDITRLVFDLNKEAFFVSNLSDDKKILIIKIFTVKPGTFKPGEKDLVVLDPGHGGSDPGAIGPTGLKEKYVNLEVAKSVKEMLLSQKVKSILTREDDNYVGLYERSNIANNIGANIFVSIHMNAHENRNASGTSVFYYCYRNEQKEKEIIRQNKSKKLAEIIQQSLLDALDLKDRGVRQANFAVLRTTNMPAVLIEAAFISNYAEENLLAQAYFRQKIAKAVTQGIMNFLVAQKV